MELDDVFGYKKLECSQIWWSEALTNTPLWSKGTTSRDIPASTIFIYATCLVDNATLNPFLDGSSFRLLIINLEKKFDLHIRTIIKFWFFNI